MSSEVAERGYPLVPRRWGEETTATVGYGYGISITPLHLVSAFAGVINGGIYHEPTLLKDNKNRESHRVVSFNTSKEMRKLLRGVVVEGSGKRANVLGYEVAGKTGTANKLVNGKYVDKKVMTSFLATFPASNPQYALFLMMDEPKATKETWGFSFERWYQNGFWPDSCMPYSLFDLQKMVSHVTATIFTFALEGKTLKALQLGTVMTDPDYRGRGLSRWLIDRVLEDFEQQVDFVFLYANDSVLDFYPKFGFKRAPEFFAVAEWTDKDRIAANKADVRKLDVTQQQDQQILMRIASQTTAQYRMTPLQNQSMLFLYSGFSELSFLENSLY